MQRPLLSFLVAVATTIAGLAVFWIGAANKVAMTGLLSAGSVDPSPSALALAGILILGGASASLALHWVGVLVVGAIHSLLGFLALAVPLGNPFEGGVFSPVFHLTRMFLKIDRALGDGALIFYFSGTALIIGTFLVGSALGVRSRRLAEPSTGGKVVFSAVLGGVLVLATALVLFFGGGEFARAMLQYFSYDTTLAVVVIVGGVLAGFAGLLLRWSSAGVVVAAGVVSVVALVLFLAPEALPLGRGGNYPVSYGMILATGITFLGAALAGTVRPRPAVPGSGDAL